MADTCHGESSLVPSLPSRPVPPLRPLVDLPILSVSLVEEDCSDWDFVVECCRSNVSALWKVRIWAVNWLAEFSKLVEDTLCVTALPPRWNDVSCSYNNNTVITIRFISNIRIKPSPKLITWFNTVVCPHPKAVPRFSCTTTSECKRALRFVCGTMPCDNVQVVMVAHHSRHSRLLNILYASGIISQDQFKSQIPGHHF